MSRQASRLKTHLLLGTLVLGALVSAGLIDSRIFHSLDAGPDGPSPLRGPQEGSLRQEWRVGLDLVLGVSTLSAAAAEERVGGRAVGGQGPLITSDDASAEVNLPTPTRYVIVLHGPNKVRTIHTRNDILFDPRDPIQSFTVLQVDPETVTLRENRTGRTHVWRSGASLEGLQGLVLAGTVMVNQLRYQYRTVERVVQAEPVLLSVEGSVAFLEKEVLRKGTPATSAPSPTSGGLRPPHKFRALSPTLSKLTRVKEVDAETYEIDGEGLRSALENVGQMVSDLKLMISPTLSAQSGVGFQVSSEVADGILSQSGFTVTNSKAAQIFGIEVGDTILKVNNSPVTSPLNAWWAYQEFVIKNPTQSEMRVDIRRDGSLVTKTFRVR